MAVKPSTAAEEAVRKMQEQVTCAICLEVYKQPKMLQCFHVYCEQCLQGLVHEGDGLLCPQCRKVTPLPVGGVSDLQEPFHDIQDALKKVSSEKCKICKKRDAVGFCRICGFVCAFCDEFHQYWDDLKHHEIIDLDTFTGDVTTLLLPPKKTLFCWRHPKEKADIYCETCEELICQDCIVHVHHDHQYDLVTESFAKQEKEIVDSLKPVKEQIVMLESAIKLVHTQCAAVVEQKTAVVAEIHAVMAHLRQVLEVRETELVSQAEQTAQQKLKRTVQQNVFELQLGQLKSCHDFVEKSRHICSQGEILGMKSLLVKEINELTASFKPATLVLAEHADMRFTHRLSELVETCQQFGKVYCHPVCPEKCQASGKGIQTALREQTAILSVEAFDKEGEAYLWPVESLMCELVASDGSNQVRGTVKRRNGNRYDISYQPRATGEHQLHILIEEQPILNSPFTVTVLPNLTAPAGLSSYYKTDDRYPGVYFYGSPLKQSVTSSGAHITSWWEEIGVEFQIPPGAVPEGESLDLSVWPCCSGPFQLPDGYELASPMFLILPSFKFARKITIKIEHFVCLEDEENCDEMVFLSAPTTPQSSSDNDKELIYPCSVLGKGTFLPEQTWGKISLTHFCHSSIGRKKCRKDSSSGHDIPASKKMRNEERYVYQVYRDKFEDIAIFSAFLDQKCYFTALANFMKEKFPDHWTTCYVNISILGDRISLEWPSNSGWEVISDREPCMLTKAMLMSNNKLPYPPMIKLEIEIERDSMPAAISSHVWFAVVGTAEESKFKLRPKPRQGQSPLSSASSDPFSPPPLLSPQLQQISPQWSTQPHTKVVSSSSLSQEQSNTASISVRSSQPCTLELLLDNIKIPEWYHLGLKLIHDKPERVLNLIEKNHPNDSDTALRKMFQLALERDPDLSWPKVVEALRAIKQHSLAREIKQNFCPN